MIPRPGRVALFVNLLSGSRTRWKSASFGEIESQLHNFRIFLRLSQDLSFILEKYFSSLAGPNQKITILRLRFGREGHERKFLAKKSKKNRNRNRSSLLGKFYSNCELRFRLRLRLPKEKKFPLPSRIEFHVTILQPQNLTLNANL